MLSRLETDHLFFWFGGQGGGGAGADFFQQLKLDFLNQILRQSESIFCIIQLSTIAIRPHTLVKLQFRQISIYT